MDHSLIQYKYKPRGWEEMAVFPGGFVRLWLPCYTGEPRYIGHPRYAIYLSAVLSIVVNWIVERLHTEVKTKGYRAVSEGFPVFFS